jgi:NTP pyrophosphatase (non-canonical NTP hydrolase)
MANREIARAYLKRLYAQRGPMPVSYYFMKLTSEAHEAADAWMDTEGWSRHPGGKEHEAEELADTVISAYAAAQVRDIDLDAAIAAKHEVLQERDWTPGSAEHRFAGDYEDHGPGEPAHERTGPGMDVSSDENGRRLP